MTCQPISKGMEQGYEQPQIHTTNNVGPQIDNNICVMVTKRKNQVFSNLDSWLGYLK